MARCYAVLWIPTVNHIPIPFENPYHNGKLVVDISDIEDSPFPIMIKTNGRDVEVYLSLENNPHEFEHFITLKYEDSSHNGMIKYSFEETTLDDSDFCFSAANFPEIVYHIIKSFYHVHEFHEDESDSSLQPYVCNYDIDIRQPDNAALLHYLRNHERSVLGLVNKAKKFLRHVVDLEKNNPSSTIREYEAFPNMYVMVLGYDAYIRSLYNSVYNRQCRTTNEQAKQLRRLAFNIENSARYFNVLYVFFDTKIRKAQNLTVLKKAEDNLKGIGRNLETSERNLKASLQNVIETKKAAKDSTRWAIGSIIFSFVIGIASIWYSVKLSEGSSSELNETRIKLENVIQESLNDINAKRDTVLMLDKER